MKKRKKYRQEIKAKLSKENLKTFVLDLKATGILRSLTESIEILNCIPLPERRNFRRA